MCLQFTSLNSGSNGNCYYVGNSTDAVLIDAGLSCRETERRMKRLNLCMQLVKAIFVSHEHIDHVRGLAGLAEKYNLPVYVTDKTKANCYHLKQEYAMHFTAHKPVNIGSLSIVGFPKNHDAADAHSFNITHKDITVGVYTDIGMVCENLIYYFKKCHAAFLEANYDTTMLENGKYPVFLKDRIRNGNGHLSNEQALDLFVQHKPNFMSHLILAHLSKDNNDVQLVQQLFSKHANDTQIIVASRYNETEIYTIKSNLSKIENTLERNYYQATLF